MKRQASIIVLATIASSCALAADSPLVHAPSPAASAGQAAGSAMGGVSAPASSAPRPFGSIEPRPGDPLAIQVYPRMIRAQSTASVRLRIEPDVRSRGVWIEWDSLDGGGGAHLINLEGEDAPIRFDFPLKRMDAGQYEVTATLLRSDGTRVTRATTLTVFGR